MTEQFQPQAGRDARDLERDTRAELYSALGDALVREGVALVALAVVLLVLDPRVRLWVQAKVTWVRRSAAARRAAADQEVARFRQEIADFEHQAERGRDGGCGCGQ